MSSMRLHPLTKTEMSNWLDNMRNAIEKGDKRRILELYDENSKNVNFAWDLAPDHMQAEYDNLTDKANEVLDV